MKSLAVFTRSSRRNLAILAAFAMTSAFARADFTGDFVTGAIVGGPGAFAVDPPNNIVGPGVEFVIKFLGTPAFNVDITGPGSMSVRSVFGQRISTGAGEVLVLGDLDWLPGPARIVGITNFQTNEAPEISIEDVTFTDREVRLNMSPNIWEVDGYVSWDVLVESDCDPCDANCDGEVNAFDIEPFINDVFNGDPQCSPCASDANGDGELNAFDIEPFIECLFGP